MEILAGLLDAIGALDQASGYNKFNPLFVYKYVQTGITGTETTINVCRN